MKTMCYYIHTLTALHAGTGQGVGVIDLPIAREKSTGLPIVPGSGIKGVLREELRPIKDEESDFKETTPEQAQQDEQEYNKATKKWTTLFGPDAKEVDNDKEEERKIFAGALNIQDAQLLCLPVRSVYGVFAWVTCPFILQRYKRDLDEVYTQVKEDRPNLPVIPSLDGKSNTEGKTMVLVTTGSQLCSSDGQSVFLEDLDFQTTEDRQSADLIAGEIAQAIFPTASAPDDNWQDFFQKRFLIIPDNVFSFLAETATEVRARIKLKEGTRTVEDGALWYEENLPAETLLWGLLGCDRSRRPKEEGEEKESPDLMEYFRSDLEGRKGKDAAISLQIGGNATVGRGRVRWIPGQKGE
ncbi:type III-B CRISPR module RAMP protein Cmr4 [Candidatus Electrothrix sp.]|uniref:type III-B CRISPR module RAMP protein Cmr4 n=1 Tax=Candidatus Electrothrix sp. TaxID=2170559 RepID=UPI0040566154